MKLGRLAAAFAFLATGLAARASAQGNVWVVAPAPGPGVDFTQIRDAVAASSDGDVVLAKAGTYSQFGIVGKSLAVVADLGAEVVVLSTTLSVRVDGTGAGTAHRVVLQGFLVNGSFPGSGEDPPLRLQSSSGSIWVDACSLRGGKPTFLSSAPGETAMQVTSCASVVLARSSAVGGEGMDGDDFFDGGDGGHAVTVTGSFLAAFGGELTGGRGGLEPILCPVLDGGDGLSMSSSTAFASNVRLTGGVGGTSTCSGGPGGDGAQLGAASSGVFQACAATGGSGGPPLPGDPPGADGLPFHDAGGSHVLLPGPPRTLAFESPLREGQSSTLTVTGVPGELAILLASSQPGRIEHPAVVGPILVALPALSIPLGAIGAGGSASAAFTVNELGPGVESALVFVQPVLIAASGSITVGTPAPLVLLDGAF